MSQDRTKDQTERLDKDSLKAETAKAEIEAAQKMAGTGPGQQEAATAASDSKDAKIAELTNLLQHVQADFENYKKRADKEHQNHLLTAKAQVIKRLLPVLDTFDHALKESYAKESHAKECPGKDCHGDADGLKRVYSQLFSALESEGLRPIKALGEKLDPYRHECLEEDCSSQPKNIIIDEIQKGYMLGEYVLRHSLVKVSSGKPARGAEAKADTPDKKDGKEVKG
jgi:molecular chaperone GrpE